MFAIWFDGTWCEVDNLSLYPRRSNNFVVVHSYDAAIDFFDVLLGLTPLPSVH